MRITVLMGGTSSERDVSLATGIRVTEALRSRGHVVTAVDTARGPLSPEEEQRLLSGGVKTAPPSREELQAMAAQTLPQMVAVLPALAKADVVFLGLHGGAGEDGTIQAILDLANIPYTGSGHLASALAMDKDMSKHLFRQHGVQTADWVMVTRGAEMPDGAELEKRLGMPLIVKPSKEGSTVGLSIVRSAGELTAAIEEAMRFDDEVIVEEFIAGRELTVGILGGEALPVGEIIPKHEIYDYECKYTAGMAVEVFPADITDAQRNDVQEQARRAFAALKLRGCARIDFRMSETGEMFCLEANTLPGMTGTSLIPQAAQAAGIGFAEFCERIVMLALPAATATGTRNP
jgi:D-alanine-D-alanine ligase